MQIFKSSLLVGIGCAIALSACKKETPPAAPAAKREVARQEPPRPPEVKEVKKDVPPKWPMGLPAAAVAAKVGDMVWATIPQNNTEMARFGLYKVDSIAGNTATLADGIGTKYPDVPGAVIHAAGDGSKLKVGDLAFGYAWGASKVVGLVSKMEAGKASLKYGWVGKMTEKMFDHAQPLVAGVAPIAVVAYDNRGTSTYKGLCIALHGEKAWIHSDSGHVEVLDKAKLKPLTLAAGYKEGATVQAYGWGFGFQAGTVQKVVEPGLYTIKIAGKDKTQDFFFYDLTEKL